MSLEVLMKWAGKEFTREDLFLMEAGSNSFEIARRLAALGLRAVVMESAYVGKRAKDYEDNDKMAAARIALVFLAGGAPCVWQPDPITCERRELLHAYQKAVNDNTAQSNLLKGYLNQFGVRSGSRGLHLERTKQWVLDKRDKREWSPLQLVLLTGYFSDIAHQAARRQSLLRMICQQVCEEPLMLRCMKVLGIGKVNAFALLAIIGNVRRFTGPEKLVAYLGLNPGRKRSGNDKDQRDQRIGVGHRGRGDLRSLLVQGAQAVMRMGGKTELGKWGWKGWKLFARKGYRNIAVVAVARKMAVQVWHVLSGNPPTMVEKDRSLAAKLQKLIVVLGKDLRAKMGLPSTPAEGIRELQTRLCSSSPDPNPKASRPSSQPV